MRHRTVLKPLFVLLMLSPCFVLAGSEPRPRPALAAPLAPAAPSTLFGNWSSLGGTTPYTNNLSRPFAGRNADGRIEIFAVGGDDRIYHKWQTAPNGGWSAGWLPFSGAIWSCGAVASNADGRMEVIALIGAGTMWNIAQGTPNGPFNPNWGELGAPQGVQLTCPIAVGPNLDGRLQVYSVGDDNNLWSSVQPVSGMTWEPWVNMGNPTGFGIFDPAWGREQDGRQTLFVRAETYSHSAREVYFRYQTAPSDGWSNWVLLGKPADDSVARLAVSRNLDGRQEIFAEGNWGDVYHQWQLAPNSGWSATWSSYDYPPRGADGPIAVGHTSTGTMELFIQNFIGDYWHLGQVYPSDGWGTWQPIFKPGTTSLTGDPAIAANANGLLEFFSQGNDGAIWHIRQSPYNAMIFLPLISR